MTSAQNDFVWVGPVTGLWQTPANWNDTTTVTNPATAAPGSLDSVLFQSASNLFQTIGGVGAAATLTLDGENAVTGTITVGTPAANGTLTNNSTLEINKGGTLTAFIASTATGITANAGTLAVSGTLDFSTGYGTLAASNGGSVKIGTLTLGPQASLSVDGTSTFEVGSTGGSAAGVLTVDAGATLSESESFFSISSFSAGEIIGNMVVNGLLQATAIDFGSYLRSFPPVTNTVSGSGTVEVTGGGEIYVYDSITAGSLTFQVDAGGSLQLANVAANAGTITMVSSSMLDATGTIGTGNSVTLTGSFDVLQIGTGVNDLAVTGFIASDVLIVNGPSITSSVFANGTLSLLSGTTTVDSVHLIGNYSTDVLQTNYVSSTDAQFILAPAGSTGAVSGGTNPGETYVWVGPSAGTWQTAADWENTTTNTNPAPIAPGSLDAVTFYSPGDLYQFIGGSGKAKSLTLNGENAVTGTITADTLTNKGSLQINSGGTLTATTLTNSAAITAAGGTLAISGELNFDVGSNTIEAAQGGLIQVGTLSIGFGPSLMVDPTSTIEIGSAGGAAAGALTVDSGATLTEAGSFFQISPDANGNILGNIVVDGLLQASMFNLGYFITAEGESMLSGSGTVEVTGGGAIYVFDSIGAGSLTFKVDTGGLLQLANVAANAGSVTMASNSTLDATGTIGAGNSVTLTGTNDVLQIGTGVNDLAVTGFGTSDVLVVNGPSITSSTFTNGTLSLLSGTSTVDSINLIGNFSGDVVLANSVSSSQTEIVLSAPSTGGPISPGNTPGHNYVWVGPAAGIWQNVNNWNDTTSVANPANIAPGSLDTVTLNSSSSLFQFVGGSGKALNLTLNGENALIGTFAVGTLTNTGSLEINSGGTLTANTLTDSSSVSVTAGTLAVAGTLSFTSGFGTLAAAQGGSIHVQTLTLGSSANVSIDATSTFEIGSTGGAAAGALTVDAGATLTESGPLFITSPDAAGSIDGNIAVAGRIEASLIDLGNPFPGGVEGTVSGTGTVEVTNGGEIFVYDSLGAGSLTFQVDTGGSLQLANVAADAGTITMVSNSTLDATGTIGAGNSITLTGTNDVLQIGTGVNDVAVTGFGTSDSLVVNGPSITSFGFASGTLSLLAGTSTVDAIKLVGNYASDTLLLSNVSSTQTQIVVAPAVSGTAGVLTIAPLPGATIDLSTILAQNTLTDGGTIDSLSVLGSGTVQADTAVTIKTLDVLSHFGLAGSSVTTDPVTIETGGTIAGYGTISGGETVSGVIIASGGTLELGGTITGSGTLHIAAGATLKLDAADSTAPIVFDTPGSGTLNLAAAGDAPVPIEGFAPGGVITVAGAGGATANITVAGTTTTMTLTSGGTTLGSFAFNRLYSTTDTPQFNALTGTITACYAEGTRLATPTGPVAIERLRAGDTVLTASGACVPVAWLGERSIDCARHPRPEDVWPVRVRAHAVADHQPSRDLILSPDHALLLDGALIPVRYLLNGVSIVQEQAAQITYWHVELPRHDIVLAEGLPAESYLDTGNRSSFVNGGPVVALHPEFARLIQEADACAPFLVTGPALDAAQARLAARAAARATATEARAA